MEQGPIGVASRVAPAIAEVRTWRDLLAPYHLARIALGAGYLAGGLFPYIHIAVLPISRPIVGELLWALIHSDILYVSKSIEIVFGLLLLANRWVPLAIAATAPVLFFIAWVDLYLDPFPFGVVGVTILIVSQTILAWHCRDHFLPVFSKRVGL